MLLFLGDLFIFEGALSEFQEQRSLDGPRFSLELFASFMRTVGMDAVMAARPPFKDTEVLSGNSGLVLEPDTVGVRDYRDLPLPESRLPESGAVLAQLLGDGFGAFFERFSCEHTFQCGIVQDALEPAAGWQRPAREFNTILTRERCTVATGIRRAVLSSELGSKSLPPVTLAQR
jgi:hypothetical protein